MANFMVVALSPVRPTDPPFVQFNLMVINTAQCCSVCQFGREGERKADRQTDRQRDVCEKFETKLIPLKAGLHTKHYLFSSKRVHSLNGMEWDLETPTTDRIGNLSI